MRFNSDLSQFEGYNGTAWASVGGSAISNDVATSTYLYPIVVTATTGTALNVYTSNAKYLYKPSNGELCAPVMYASNGLLATKATITSNYVAPAGANLFSVGPLIINPGATVTLAAGQRWVVL